MEMTGFIAWGEQMTDERYVFKQTEMERKRLTRGAYHKKRGSKSKKCTLPSDRMSQEEKDAMNGEVKTYQIRRPMNWSDFKRLPKDLQAEYLLMLTDKRGAGRKDVADMFGISAQGLSDYLNDHHPGKYYFKGKRSDQKRFLEWLGGEAQEEKIAEMIPETEKNVEIVETIPEPVKVSVAIDRGHFELSGNVRSVFEKMIAILGESEAYKISIDFEKAS